MGCDGNIRADQQTGNPRHIGEAPIGRMGRALSGGAGGPNLSVELLVNMHPSHSRPEGVRGGALTVSATGCPLHRSVPGPFRPAHASRAGRDENAAPSLFGPVSYAFRSLAEPLARDRIILIHARREKLVASFGAHLLDQHHVGRIGKSLFQKFAWGLVRRDVSGVIEV